MKLRSELKIKCSKVLLKYIKMQAKKRKMSEEELHSFEESSIVQAIDTNLEARSFITLNDGESTIKLKVSKSLLSKESDVFKQLFECDGGNEDIEINEKCTFQLAALIKSLHNPFTPPQVWNDIEARLVCKYLITSQLQYWAKLSNEILAAIAGLHFEISCMGDMRSVYKCKGSYYVQQGKEDPYEIRKTSNRSGRNWIFFKASAPTKYCIIFLQNFIVIFLTAKVVRQC